MSRGIGLQVLLPHLAGVEVENAEVIGDAVVCLGAGSGG
jgi:hypothetical protein